MEADRAEVGRWLGSEIGIENALTRLLASKKKPKCEAYGRKVSKLIRRNLIKALVL